MVDVAADGRLVTDAALALLRNAGLTVGDGEAPRDAVSHYAIVYPVSTVMAGTMESPYADAERTVQVQSVGTTREQAQWVADEVSIILLGTPHRTIELTGRALTGAIRYAGGTGVRRDDDTANPSLFFATDRFVFPTTPA